MSLDIPSAPGQVNPASAPERAVRALGRIPMSVPQQKLAVPDIPGYHLHWMLGTPERLAQAKRAGYVFVEQGEVQVLAGALGDDEFSEGGTDMGSQVSIVAGGDTDAGGQAVRLVLMKLKQEWWEDDQKALEKRSDQLVATLRSGRVDASQAGETSEDFGQRYTPKGLRNTMFDKKPRRA